MHISIYSNLLPIVITVCSAASISNEEIAKILGDRETLDPMRSINTFQGIEDIDAFKNELGAMTDLPGDMDDNLFETLGSEDDSDDRVDRGFYDTEALQKMFPAASNDHMSLPRPSYPKPDRLPFFNDKKSFTNKVDSEDDAPISVERRNPFCNRRRGCRGKRSRVQELVRNILRKRFLCNRGRGCRSRQSRAENIQGYSGYAAEKAGVVPSNPCGARCQQSKQQKMIEQYLFGDQTVKNFLANLKLKATVPSTQSQYPVAKNTRDKDKDDFEYVRSPNGMCGTVPCPT